ncbi:hypothetical protein A6A08_05755 [Nocardiopsis sp. TSRI0078]|uniref:hypothetical protein n=1 Tax=unclassified Nocardiopsis TaxID=2649073 RepID=UPI0009688DD6|nr:hypothetical protein [Nocardiopsis sp. TSRI0078]OKI19093.1 hypothetical protein A6A08_05755 [Nocardiopsis sp. TSRI0078]
MEVFTQAGGLAVRWLPHLLQEEGKQGHGSQVLGKGRNMYGKFPEDPTTKELRTLLGLRMVGLLLCLALAAWRWWEEDLTGLIVFLGLAALVFLFSMLPRLIRLQRRKERARPGGGRRRSGLRS